MVDIFREQKMFKQTIVMLSLIISSFSQARQIDRFFHIDEEQVVHEVRYENVDKLLRSIPAEKYNQVRDKIAIHAVQMDDGEYALHAHVRGFGGGLGGATVGAFVGKFGVSAIGHGTIYLISGAVGLVNPVAGVMVGAGLESTCGWAIEAASVKAAIGCGIIGATLTGPV